MTRRTMEIELRDGPVRVLSNDGTGIDAERDFTNEIRVREFYPSDKDSDFYVLTLRKPVDEEDVVGVVEKELRAALLSLAKAWPFAGADRLQLAKRQVQEKPNSISNAEELRDQFAADRGVRIGTVSFTASACVCGTWHEFPLRRAIEICQVADQSICLSNCLDYYYRSQAEPGASSTDLYKIRDKLSIQFKRGGICRHALSICRKEWSKFGDDANVLRHPSDRSLSGDDIASLFSVGREWISKYIRYLESEK